MVFLFVHMRVKFMLNSQPFACSALPLQNAFLISLKLSFKYSDRLHSVLFCSNVMWWGQERAGIRFTANEKYNEAPHSCKFVIILHK